MAVFKTAYLITKKVEGGWHNGKGLNKFDRGGETYFGIARKQWPEWKGWEIIDSLKSNDYFPRVAENDSLLQVMVLEFYKKEFWDVLRLDQLEDQPIANELFDTSVNTGYYAGAIMLQRALNYLNRDQSNWNDIAVDGKIGSITIGAINRLNSTDRIHIYNLLNILQGDHYLKVIDRDRTQEHNLRGWLTRIELMKLNA